MDLWQEQVEAAKKFDMAMLPDKVCNCLSNLYKQDKEKAYPLIVYYRNLWTERTKTGMDYMKLIKRLYILTARDIFEDYLIAVEFDIPYKNKFYLPRRGYLKRLGIIQGYQDILDGKLDILTISMPKRSGKAVTLDTPIVTPTGFIRMGDIKLGDTVIGSDGGNTIVTGVYPQGKVPIYEVKFTDGSVVKTCGNHLWSVKYHDLHKSYGKSGYFERVLSTADMLNIGVKSKGEKSSHSVFAVQNTQPVEFYEQKVELHPYLLGVLLGDGCFVGNTISFTKPDKEIAERIKNLIPNGDRVYCQNEKKSRYLISSKERKTDIHGHPLKSVTAQILCDYGLLGKRSWEKFVPQKYLINSVEVRLELLRGLLDTDGSCNKVDIEYSTTSPHLRDAVIFLVKSLGGQASYKERMGRYRKDGQIIYTRTNYRLHLQFPKNITPFYLQRKKERYQPQRTVLYRYIDSITPCGEEEAQCITVDNKEHLFLVTENFIPTHNSQTEINFVTMLSGKFPNRSSLIEGTGDDLVDSFYKGCLQYIDTDGGYCFKEIFPQADLVQTKADTHIIDLGNKSRFPTIMCRSIDARQVGLSEATNVLCLDDCVEGREEAKNRQRLDDKWEVINGDVIGRAIEGTPIIATGTRYSIYDPIGRLQEKADTLGLRRKSIEAPALNEKNESNYEYYNPKLERKVFTTEYFQNERKSLSEEQFESEFQQQPFEAKGVLFPRKDLNRFFELPPDKDPDYIFAVCDTAEGGGDYTTMPIAYIYGDDVFILDLVYDSSTPDITKPECAKKLTEHKVGSALFESNNAGAYFARDVDELVKKMGGKCGIQTKRTISNKKTRIELASDNIKKHFYFLDESKYTPMSQYGQAMKELTTYTRIGKVPHDDFADALSILENAMRNFLGNPVEIVKRPF